MLLLRHRSTYFYLFRNLAKVANVSEDCAPYHGVFSILLTSLSVEVRMESVDTFYSSGTLLAVSKNKVDPQVEMGTNIVTFQGLNSAGRKIAAQQSS